MLLFSFLVIACGWLNHKSYAAECACPTMNVHIRDGPGTNHAIVGMLVPPHCLTYKGKQTTVGEHTWASVDHNGKDAWVATEWLHIHGCEGHHIQKPTQGHGSHDGVQLPGCPHIVTRHEWGARNSNGGPGLLTQLPMYIFIHHSATGGCHTQANCASEVRSFQNYHMDSKHYSDIEYSFLIGEDGNVYEGRGWDEVGAHTLGHNHDGLGFCVIGTFTSHLPNSNALSAVKKLIDCAHQNHKVIANFILKGHRDVRPTECPGQKFYDLIKTWPHYG